MLNKIKIHTYIFFMINSVGLFIPFLSVYFDLPEELLPSEQFQRAGSLVVLFMIWAELYLIQIYTKYYPGSLLLSGGLDNHEILTQWKQSGLILMGILATIGTVIWGYGDLIFEYYQR